jgi:hypothetical protein
MNCISEMVIQSFKGKLAVFDTFIQVLTDYER